MAAPIVRDIWRRLPVNFRRGLAHGALSAFAPRLGPEPVLDANAPRVVVGFLTSPSGLGQAARLAMKAFAAQGHDVYGIDLSRNFFESAGRVPFAFKDGRGLRGPAHALININAPYMSYVFQLLGHAFLRDKLVTGYWAWELPRAPESWRAGFARAHRIAAPSMFVADAVRALSPLQPIIVAPHPVALESLPRLPKREANAPFTVAFAFNVASGFERKNPLALIAAFKAAFGASARRRLRLLASGTEHYPQGGAALQAAVADAPNIEITYDALDREAYWRWFGAPDLYASLHRAEGFGLTLAESMRVGVPVMATDWSANAEYMNAENALPVRFKLVPVVDAQAKYPEDGEAWAEADRDHAAELLTRAAADSAWLSERAQAGRRDAMARFSTFPL